MKVIAFGTFDLLHPGHLNYLYQAKRLGNFLIVIIARDVNVKKNKKKLPIQNEIQRKINIEKLEIANKVVLGNINDKYNVIKKYKPDIIALGYDQKADIKKLKKFKAKIIRLKPYKSEIYKSSKLKVKYAIS